MPRSQQPELDTKETLELFVEKAEELAQDAASTQHFNGLLGVFRTDETEGWQTYRELKGHLLSFRIFIQPNEHLAIFPISVQGQIKRPKLLDLPNVSPLWREQAERVYYNIVALFCGYDEAKKVQNSTATLFIDRDLTPLPTGYSYNNKPITRWEILDIFLYGLFAHTTKHKIIKQWQQDPILFGNLKFEFVGIVGFISGQIWELMQASKEELNLLTRSNKQEEQRQ